jgi:hypothetical protein
LFAAWLHSPGDDKIKKTYWDMMPEEIDPPDTEDLAELGYSDAEMQKIMKELGYGQ